MNKLLAIFSIILLFFSSFTLFSSQANASAPSIPPFSITDKRVGINSYIVTFNNPDNATINISVANSTTAHNFIINRTTSLSYNLTSNLIFLAYWNNVEIGSLILDYTSSIPTISVTSTQSENYVSISVSQLNVYTATISYESQIIFSTLLTSPTTSFVYQTYPYVSYINVSQGNFTLISKAVPPPSIPQYKYNISISLNSNSTYSISYSINMPSELFIYSGSLLIENETLNGSGTFYIPTPSNATSMILIHDNSTVLVKGFPSTPVQPLIRDIYHNSTVYRNSTIIQVEKIVNFGYVALSFIMGVMITFAGMMVINKRKVKNEQ